MDIKIGDVIANQIELCDLKQKDVAKALGIPYSTFNNYVCNKRLPDLETTFKICKYLKININKIYDTDNNETYPINKKEAHLLKLYRKVDSNFQDKLSLVVENLIDTLYEEKK